MPEHASLDTGVIVQWGNPGSRTTKCPHCGVFSQFSGRGVALTSQVDQTVFAIYQCVSCEQQIGVEGRVREPQSKFEVRRVYPAPRPVMALREVPPSVEASLNDAVICAAVGLPVPAAVMCRRAIELVTRDREAGGANLRDRIDALAIPGGLKEIAHGIRLLGNEAAHPDAAAWDTVSADDAASLIDLAYDMIEQVYDLPARIANLRARTGQA